MIRLGKGIYLHYTTAVFFVICWFERRLELLFVSYFTAFLHEAAHLFSALLIGIEPSYIAFFPFGVNLRIKSRIMYSISDEILLYMSGPLINAILALFSQIFLYGNKYGRYFYWNNIGLFLFNLLPILPLDGGMVIKRVLSDRVGSKRACKLLKIISVLLIFILTAIEIVLVIRKSFNFSLIFILVFLTANIFTENEKYSVSFVKELAYIKEKRKKECRRVRAFLVNEGYSGRKLAENFNMTKSYIVFVKNKKGNIVKTLTEEEIIDKLIK